MVSSVRASAAETGIRRALRLALSMFRARSAALGVLALCVAPGAAVRADEILVSAAASLTDAFNEIGRAYAKANPGSTARFNFGGSGALSRQIAMGAPVDLFASASPVEMDQLMKKGLIDRASRANIASNRLALIAPKGRRLRRWADLGRGSVRRVAIANPETVPAGRYAKEVLQRRGLWSSVQKKAVLGENVRQTLSYVAAGDVDAGIVFATDAQIDRRRVRILETAIPGKDHTPIVYPAAVLRDAPHRAEARRFLSFLQGPTSRAILRRHGFMPGTLNR